MRVLLYVSAVVLLGACATWAYRVNYTTQATLNRVVELRSQIAEEREAIDMLRAEWTYLNRPDRLHALVVANLDTLGLAPLKPEQFGEAAMVAYPPRQPDTIDVSGLVRSVNGGAQ